MIITRGYGARSIILKGYGAICHYIKKKADIQRGGGFRGTNYIGGSFPISVVVDCVLQINRNLNIKQKVKSLVYKPYKITKKILATFTKKFEVHKEYPLAVFRNITRNIHSTSLIVKDITRAVSLSSLISRKIEHISLASTFLKRNIFKVKDIRGTLTSNFYTKIKVIGKIRNNLLQFLLLDDDDLIFTEILRRKNMRK